MNLLFSCIGRRGYIARYFRRHLSAEDRIIGTSSTPWTPGFTSCDEAVLMPPYRDPDYKKAIVDLCHQKKIDALFSFMDEDVAILSSLRTEIEGVGTTLVMPSSSVANVCLDKWKAFEFFTKNGFATARSFLNLDSALDAVQKKLLSFPLVVKPRFGFGSANTFIARSAEELSVFFNYCPDMLIQEFLSGDTYNLDLLADLNGKVISVIPWRKLRSRLGETEQSITVEAPELLECGTRLVDALSSHVGPMDIDLYVSDGVISVLEMNPRFGGGYPVSEFAGADFPAQILKMLRGEKVAPAIGNYRRNMVMMKDLHPFGEDANRFFLDTLHLPRETVLIACQDQASDGHFTAKPAFVPRKRNS